LEKILIEESTGAFALLDGLIRNGTKHIFGYPGGAILPIYDELNAWENQGLIKHILVRHEQAAAHAADAYARTTGNVGVCFATSGPGATNLVTGIATAQIDSVPMVVVTGQVGRSFIGTDAFQEVDIFGITLPIVKHSYTLKKAKDICRIINEAFYIANHGRPGPVLIDIPKDVGLELIKDFSPIQTYNSLRLKDYHIEFNSNKTRIHQALFYITHSSQPLIYVGGGAVISNAKNEVYKLARYFNIPVTTTLKGKGSFNENHSLCLGMLGMHGTAYANFAVNECDLLIAIGARFDDRVTGKLDEFAAHAKIIHIDIDPAEIAKNCIPHVALIGDVKKILHEILEAYINNIEIYKPKNTKAWRNRIRAWREAYPLLVPTPEEAFSPQQVINEIGTLVSQETIFTTDVGQHQMWAAQFLKCGIRKWVSSSGLGTMGFGVPAAIGAQIANFDTTILCVTGDASFQMNPQELGTIAQYNLPIKIAIINNKFQGMVRQWQESFYDSRYSHSNMSEGQPNFLKLAESYGIKGLIVKKGDNLKQKVQEMLNHDGPILVDFRVNREENCYPMVAPGKSNAQMIGTVDYDPDIIFTEDWIKEKNL
uniref:acetohydroxyacid synthase large subunit n=1 Tax=Vacuolaria virescens TaxID=44451 RepID=UPI0021138F11